MMGGGGGAKPRYIEKSTVISLKTFCFSCLSRLSSQAVRVTIRPFSIKGVLRNDSKQEQKFTALVVLHIFIHAPGGVRHEI